MDMVIRCNIHPESKKTGHSVLVFGLKEHSFLGRRMMQNALIGG